MTVSNNYAPVVTAANGTTTVFSGSWNALSSAYLVVQLLNTTTGVYTSISQGSGSTQYQVTSLTNSGFVITFNTAPATGNNVVISRDTTPIQTIPYTTSRGFQGSVEEGSFDALTNMVQELLDDVSNSIQVSVGDTTESLILPLAAARAGQYLAFDSNGNVITQAGTTSVSVSTAMQPVVGAATVMAALSLLGGAPLASPAFTGTPTAPTPANSDVSTKLATTAFVSAIAGILNVQAFTSSGTYTPTSGAKNVLVICQAAGGGSGGTGSGTTGAIGGQGGNTNFGSLCTAFGGQPGASNNSTAGGIGGQSAGAGTGNILAVRGSSGGHGSPAGSLDADGGNGGPGIWGAGAGAGGSVNGAVGPQAGAANSGAGAGGAYANASFGAAGGGQAGGLSIYFGAASTQAVTIGAAGTAGTAGTSGVPGALGGTGFALILEFA